MNKYRLKNEKIKRKYLTWLKGAEGYSELTVISVEKAIWKYEDFTKNDDFSNFNSDTAEKFKRYLKNYTNLKTNEPLSLSTIYHILRHMNDFFTWLSGQSGYKAKIKSYDVRFLRLTKEEVRKATRAKLPSYPGLSYIKKLCSFEINNEIDQRDRALIAFTALSGMRDLAIVTLPIKCFDSETLIVNQDPSSGVRTKFSKTIFTALFRFDQELVEFVLDWYKYLVEIKLYNKDNPLFPSTNVEQESSDKFTFKANSIIPMFWTTANSMRNIFKLRSKQLGLDYFSPHKFRHFAVNEAQKYVRTAEELKAISQNVGHEHITTTFFNYGAIDTFRVADIVANMQYDNKHKKIDEYSKEELIKFIKEKL